MTGAEELARFHARRMQARFFLKAGQAGTSAKKYDEMTLPLFGLPLILECEGLLSRDISYLAKCERVIAEAALEWRS